MTPEERQALREKHHPVYWGCDDPKCCLPHSVPPHCEGCTRDDIRAVDYPCDVIEVLDAWEAERNRIVQALSHGHHDMAEIVDEIASLLFRADD